MFIKCEICGKKATYFDMAFPGPDPIATCNEHLPLNCNCEGCEKFVDLDENGKRTEPCMRNHAWEYNKKGWKFIKDLTKWKCVTPC